MTERDQRRLEILQAFGTAWGKRDLDEVMRLMSVDCVYAASVGPDPGATFVGCDAVRRGVTQMFARDRGRSETSGIFIAGDRGACEWAYFLPDGKGGERIIRGCDLFTFTGDRISRKDAFRKTTD